jgi:hypothetical protein
MNSVRARIVKIGRRTAERQCNHKFRRTYGIESVRIGQGRRRDANWKFGAEKLHLMISAHPRSIRANHKQICAGDLGPARAEKTIVFFMAILELRSLEVAAEFYFGNLVGGKIYFSCPGFGRKLDPMAGNLSDNFSLADHANLSSSVVYF